MQIISLISNNVIFLTFWCSMHLSLVNISKTANCTCSKGCAISLSLKNLLVLINTKLHLESCHHQCKTAVNQAARAQNNEDKSSRFQLSKKTQETTQQVAGHTDLTHPTVQGKL